MISREWTVAERAVYTTTKSYYGLLIVSQILNKQTKKAEGESIWKNADYGSRLEERFFSVWPEVASKKPGWKKL